MPLKPFSLGLVLLILSALGCSSQEYHSYLGKRAPAARFTMLDGSYQSLYPLEGGAVVLIFWATTCGGSRTVMQDVDNLAFIKAKDRIDFITISLDKAEKQERVVNFIEEEGLTHLKHAFSGNYYDDEAFMLFQPPVVPYFYLIAANGQVVVETSSFRQLEKYLTHSQ